MTTIEVRTATGAAAGTVEVDEAVFARTPNVSLMHQVVTAQLAARRAGTQSTLTRAEVRGGGAKPWRQKGTGRARQGSNRAPHWVGGGVALGPKPRSYAQRTPKKMIRQALYSALSDRAADGRVIVLDDWALEAPSTKRALAVLEALGATDAVLAVVPVGDEIVTKSLRNLGRKVHVVRASELNAYDVLCCDHVVFTRESLPEYKPVTRGARPAPAVEEES